MPSEARQSPLVLMLLGVCLLASACNKQERPKLANHGVSVRAVQGRSNSKIAIKRHKPVRVAETWVGDFDKDGVSERLEEVSTTRQNPYGGAAPIGVRYLLVADRWNGKTLRRRISPKLEHLEQDGTGVRDINADGTPDLLYLGYVGGAGAVPIYAGVYEWTGKEGRKLWTYNGQKSALGRHYAGATVKIENVDERYAGAEIILEEGIRKRREGNCCPSTLRVSFYGWHPQRQRYVLIARYRKLASTDSGGK
jgi:hypothetical protein